MTSSSEGGARGRHRAVVLSLEKEGIRSHAKRSRREFISYLSVVTSRTQSNHQAPKDHKRDCSSTCHTPSSLPAASNAILRPCTAYLSASTLVPSTFNRSSEVELLLGLGRYGFPAVVADLTRLKEGVVGRGGPKLIPKPSVRVACAVVR